jgi:peptide/nickel transport system permease protein
MLRFALARLLMAIPTLLIVAVAVFVLIRLIPGDPAQLLLGDLADPVRLADLRAQLGLDKSWPVQFGIWGSHVLGGDLGVSINTGEPVLQLVLSRFLVSAQIVLVAVLFATLVAVPAGMIAAWKQNRLPDLMLVGTATLLYLLMPILTLFLHEIGVLIRMARASTLEVLRLDYITHARAKGLSERAVLVHHAFRNSFGPTWTLIGLVLGNLLGGVAVVETVFTIPGLGRLLVDAIFARDYPVIQGCLLLVAVIYVVTNLVIDLCYPIFDPRVLAE